MLRAMGVPSLTTLQAGGGAETFTPAGVIEVNITPVGTDANLTEKDLWTYQLPANTLNANGRAVRISVYVETADNANTKTVRLYFAGISLGAAVSTAGEKLVASYIVVRTAPASQHGFGTWAKSGGGGTGSWAASPAGDTTAAITIKVTGQNGTAVANDVVFRAAVVEVL